MTTERLEAGRKLDALIAVEVMGWTLEGSTRGTQRLMAPGRGIAAIKERGREWSYIGHPRPILPEWSTSGACLEVLEQMRAQGWDVDVVAFDDGWIVKYAGEHAVFAPNLPHAICLAAPEAVRVEKEGE